MTVTWLAERMTCYPQHQGQTNVVFNVCWRVNANDGAYSATRYGTAQVSYNAELPFTSYDQLTQDQVIGWVQDAIGPEQVALIESSLATDIADQINPPAITLSLPWEAK